MPLETWFPLAVYYEDLEGAKEQNIKMKDYVLNFQEKKTKKSHVSKKYAWTGDVHGFGRIHNDPKFKWLVGQVEEHCIYYLEKLGHNMNKIDLYIQRAWPVISKKNQSITKHAHYNANISAVYYIDVPVTENIEDAGCFVIHNSSNQNELQKGITTGSTKAISQWNDLNCKSAQYPPVAGRLLIFPAHQQHSVDANLTDQLRLSIAFDIVMVASQYSEQDSLEFLPPQPDSWKQFARPNFKKKVTTMLKSTDLITQYEKDGYGIVEDIISEDQCIELFQFIISSYGTTEPDYIIAPKHRIHCPLKLNTLTRSSITDVLKPAYKMLDDFLQGEQALVELSSITVFPHAEGQNLHPDERNVGKYITSVFVNLAPTHADAGSLWIVPGSHKVQDKEFTLSEAIPIELPMGSAIFMNSKTWHCGGENRSKDKVRPVFYFSFGDTQLSGPTYSIRQDVRALNLTLDAFKENGG